MPGPRTLAVAIALACVSRLAPASTTAVEITDMWWNPAEPGWGMNVVLQNNIVFATFFVYDANQNATWYTAQLTKQLGNTWNGPLYATKGPWFGGAFPANSVTVKQAGTATFALSDINHANLAYSVDAVNVTKAVERQTWTIENYSGQYAGGFSISLTDCDPASYEGVQELSGSMTVAHSGPDFQVQVISGDGACTFTGTYTQGGRLGGVSGIYNCADDTQGTFQMSELIPSLNGFHGSMTGQNQYCTWSGYVGGITHAN